MRALMDLVAASVGAASQDASAKLLVEAALPLRESVTAKAWVFYHGTKSEPFDSFQPSQAVKGKQFWNPLGNGMYVTDCESFALNFGPKAHKVIIPAGSSYRRINLKDWQYSVGPMLVTKALKLAFKQAGENYDEWYNGVKPKLPPKMTREQMMAWLFDHHSQYTDEHESLKGKIASLSDADLLRYCKAALRGIGNTRDEAKRRKLDRTLSAIQRQLQQNSPYEGLYESSFVVADLGDEISQAYGDMLPRVSDAVFKKYDFVVFTETNDVIGVGKNGASALEVVIFNPALQKTVARQL